MPNKVIYSRNTGPKSIEETNKSIGYENMTDVGP